MAVKRVCDWCNADAPEQQPERSKEWGTMMQLMGKTDCCPVHEAAGANTDWKALITEAVHNAPDPGEDGTKDNPYFWQSGMDVKKGKYYHCWGHEYSAIKDVANCTAEPGHDSTIWQYVRPWPVA